MALPFLPGMTFKDPARTSFAKNQTLNFRAGSPVQDGRAKAQQDNYSHAPPPPAWKTASGETPPPWLAFDKKILSYSAYFMESIPYSREPYRVRKCNILYYLEDGSLAVMEPKVQNSGLSQGVLIRRHKPSKEDGSPLSYQDINTCMDLKIQGMRYRIYETTDPLTIDFMEQMGYPINGFEECPGDPHTDQRDFMQKSQRPIRPAKSGKDPLRQFLDYDGKVLKFYCTLDDPRNKREFRKFMIQYFLSDDTVSVVENLPPNCGRDNAPVFAKRQKPPKDFPDLQDVLIGQTVNVFNHRFSIYEMDPFTQDYFAENFGVSDFAPLDVTQSFNPVPQQEVPKYTGFGTEEDSLSSCLSLMPKPVKKDIRKSIENDKKILRFKAKLSSDKHTDSLRVFVISYFMSDDTISVYEPPQRNSGFVGGKFLERRRVKRPLKPPVLKTPPTPASPARPPSASYHPRDSDFSRSRPSSQAMSRSSSPSATVAPFTATNRGFGYTTSSSGYGYNPRKDMPSLQSSSPTFSALDSQRSSRTNTPSPPASPTPQRNRVPPLSPISQQARTRSPSPAMSQLTRSIRTQEQSMQRTNATHDEIEQEYYTANDFYVGGLIQIFNHVFVLQDADEFVLKHMEARPDEYPVSDIHRVLERVREEMYSKSELTSEWLRELDPGRTGFVPIEKFKELLRSLCPDLVEQEIITVCRRYDLDGDGQVS